MINSDIHAASPSSPTPHLCHLCLSPGLPLRGESHPAPPPWEHRLLSTTPVLLLYTVFFFIIIINVKCFRHLRGIGLSAKAGLWEPPADAGWDNGKVCRGRRWLEEGEGCRLTKPADKNCYSKSKPNLPRQDPPTPCWLLLPKGNLRSNLLLEEREEEGALIKQGAVK